MSPTTTTDPIAEARRQWEAHGWEAPAAGMAAITTLVRVHQILESRIEEALRPFGLTFARFEILRLLGFTRTGRLPMGKISDRLQVHPASVTSAVKRLERDGLIRRVGDQNDSRIVLAVILPAGTELLIGATEAINRVFATLGPSDAELDHLVDVLNQIRELAGDSVAQPDDD
ncbi:MAG TPA: MarR family transcriptional regulator [Acidimicrobiia bacterium]|nr:MarR family transcriptional regulator [Acidimicrobiia bacterium]